MINGKSIMRHFICGALLITQSSLLSMDLPNKQNEKVSIPKTLKINLAFDRNGTVQTCLFEKISSFKLISDQVKEFIDNLPLLFRLKHTTENTFSHLLKVVEDPSYTKDLTAVDLRGMVIAAAYLGLTKRKRYFIESTYIKKLVDPLFMCINCEGAYYTECKNAALGLPLSIQQYLLRRHIAPYLSILYQPRRTLPLPAGHILLDLLCNPVKFDECATYSQSGKEAEINIWDLNKLRLRRKHIVNNGDSKTSAMENSANTKLFYSNDGKILYYVTPDQHNVCAWEMKKNKVTVVDTLTDHQAATVFLCWGSDKIKHYCNKDNRIKSTVRGPQWNSRYVTAEIREDSIVLNRYDLVNKTDSGELIYISNCKRVALDNSVTFFVAQIGDSLLQTIHVESNYRRFGIKFGDDPISARINCIQFHPLKYWLLVSGAEDSSIKLWDTSNGACLTPVGYHGSSPVTAVSFNPSGEFLVSGSSDGSIKIWNSLSPIKKIDHFLIAAIMVRRGIHDKNGKRENDAKLRYRPLSTDYDALDGDELVAIKKCIFGPAY